MTNPIPPNKMTALYFPKVTLDQFHSLLDLAEKDSHTDVNVDAVDEQAVIVWKFLFEHVTAFCMWDAATGLTIQVDGHADQVKQQIEKALTEIG